MRTLIFQVLGTVASLLFGVVALLVALRRSDSADPKHTAWLLTGTAYTAAGILNALQETWAVTAFMAGPGSDTWTQYVRWAPAGNHARSFLVLAFMGLLIALPLLRARVTRGAKWSVAAALAISTLLGGVAGWMEGSFVGEIHYAAIATTGGALLVLLGIALVVHLVRESMDRILWLCLCVYGFHLAVITLWNSAVTWAAVPGSWHPPIWAATLFDMLSAVVMLGFACWALVLARRGVYVPALLEYPRPVKSAALP